MLCRCEQLTVFLISEFYLLAHISVLGKLAKLKCIMFSCCLLNTIMVSIIFEEIIYFVIIFLVFMALCIYLPSLFFK